MNTKVKILLVGSAIDPNLIRLIQNIKKNDHSDQIIFDVLHVNPRPNFESRIKEVMTYVRHIYEIDNNFQHKGLGYLKRLASIYKVVSHLDNNEYDLINIHYASLYYSFLSSTFRKKGKKVMITPWGSDVYRISNIQEFLIRKLYKNADYVSVVNGKFKLDVFKKFHVSEKKYVELGFGSTMIDQITLHENISKDEAKCKFGLQDKYLIVCGYNASPGQQHLKIIKSLQSIKEQLPENVVLIFPMTYAKKEAYIKEVKLSLKVSSISHIIYEDYLNEEDLLYIRKSADIFIHTQISDASSASVQEHILCNTIVITGQWVRYPSLEQWGVPYVVLESIDELSDKVSSIISEKRSYEIPSELKREIKSKGYNTQAKKWIDFFISLKQIESKS